MKKEKSSIFCSGLTYFILLVVFIAVRIAFLYIPLPTDPYIADLISSFLIQCLLMFGFTVGMFSILKKQKLKQTFQDFGYNKISFSSILICILIGIVCYFINIFISSFFNGIISFLGYEQPPHLSIGGSANYSVLAFILQVLAVAILPAICEETAHRGLLMKGFYGLGIKKAVLLSSLMFGLMHLNINQFFYATILGFIIALTAVISKSIFPAMIIHFMNNFLSVYFTFAKPNNWFAGNFPDFLIESLYAGNSILSVFIMSVVILGLLFLALFFLFTVLLNKTRVKSVEKMLIDISNIDNSFAQDYNNANNNKNLINIQAINDLMKEYNIKSLNSMVFTDLENKGRKMTPIELVFIVGILVLGGLVTVSTFVWGIL